MSLNPAINRASEWQWQYLKMTYNNNVETSFEKTGAATAAKGYVIEKNEEIDWQSMMVFVQTVDAAKTLDVGILSSETGGDANGFLAAVSIATAGWVRPSWTVSQGTNAAYISASTIGALFKKGQDGANTAENNAVPIFQNYLGNGTAKTLTYTCSSGSSAFVGFLAFKSRKLPDLTNFLVK